LRQPAGERAADRAGADDRSIVRKGVGHGGNLAAVARRASRASGVYDLVAV
jgi:hypothetical protein